MFGSFFGPAESAKICRDFIEKFLLSLLQYLCIAKRVAGHAVNSNHTGSG